jgi:hypothetical protein
MAVILDILSIQEISDCEVEQLFSLLLFSVLPAFRRGHILCSPRCRVSFRPRCTNRRHPWRTRDRRSSQLLSVGDRKRHKGCPLRNIEKDTESALRTAAIEESVPAMLFGGVVVLQLVITFATSRTEASVSPPASVPQITGADT